ncbi:phage repressor protein C with HTH and peptisase S24 domain [Geodermatophilus bullaregiensis]|uniref:S26 family signal peptidase n=1 Tax=Geodermatophilus bullaregiensis TaxID=1564160 RepID=UPI0027DDF071|nr:S26 family signal peptidase [Geodermatophilus bullaregiensis]MBM7805660.1 phage repressor protein C with HTH and peptisase S24 domain [Geodermatophilus bullaregiensis]
MIRPDTSERAGSSPVPPLPSAWVLARVSGPSMTPTVRHGDRLLVRRLRPGTARPGDVVLARFPSRPDLLVVKRVARVLDGGAVDVRGDNPLVTDDSRAYGPAVAVGRVVARLRPRPGRLGPAPADPGGS